MIVDYTVKETEIRKSVKACLGFPRFPSFDSRVKWDGIHSVREI